ncbi:MAG: hypothetical protein AAF291_12705 [Pseudomonadota bacterium]
MTKITHTSRKLSALLMVGASGLALASPLHANEYLFTTQKAPLETGQRMTQTEELTQIRLNNGGTASFTDNAEYQINADGSIELYQGTVTIASERGRRVSLRMPKGLEAEVFGMGAAANFTVQPDGEASGHAMNGQVRVGRDGRLRPYRAGEMWAAEAGERPRKVIANAAQSAPDAASSTQATEPQVVAISGDAGPVGAAENGIPVTLGDALAAAGASSDILAAARRVEAGVGNPALDTFPSGDLALLVGRAAEIEFANGGLPFPQAQADIIRSYLGFLARGGSGAEFLAAFSGFSLDYLNLIRAGGLPSGFAVAGGVGLADINAYLSFIERTGALAQLGASDRVLAQAYLGFLRDGGNPDLFAGSFTDLTDAYFAFVRAGGVPSEFQGASQAVLAQTIAFLSDSGLVAQLSAADQALISAFLANGGLAFTGQFQAALDDYFAFLASGNLPSSYEPVDQASLRQFLETLSNTGLLTTVLGDQAGFYADYLAFLRAGGDVDAFAGLPVNIFTNYATQLAAYRAFLDAGNAPSAFTATSPAQLQAFIAELQAAGALERFVGADASFFAAFAAFVNDGGAFDAFGGLNANIFAGYATDLQAYFAFLEAGGVPSTYEPLSQEVIAQYLAELQAAGAKTRFPPELAAFYADYFAFISGGGNPDNFAGLPVPPDFGAFAAALNAYADFLSGGGFPADFDGTDLSVLSSFIAALSDAGELDERLGANADLLNAYFAFLANGGAPNAFAGLPIYAQYVADLNAYFAFLANGGLPQDYTVLDQATLTAFLDALSGTQGGLAGFGNLDAFFTDYAAFVLGGGDPTQFAGLPVFTQYVADLNAYFAFLAGGGLPEDYTVLDQATLNAYLAALSNAQGGLTGFGNLNGFFEAYSAFVLGGGDPTQFAGLPVFTQYVADLNAYFAFLAAGGVPSEYTVLDQATLNAYLAALANAQGGLTGFGNLNAFFVDFFAFLQGGGVADDFAPLPVNVNRPRTELAGLSAFVFDGGTLQQGSGSDAQIDLDGRIASVTLSENRTNPITFDYANRDADLREFGRIGNDVAWTRYFEGRVGSNPSFSTNLLVGNPATNLPTMGTVDYKLVGGTAPNLASAETETQALFTGDLAVAFGSTFARVGLNFDVLTATEGYRVATAGGAAGAAQGGLIVSNDGNMRFEALSLGATGLTDTSCNGFCDAQVFGGLFGEAASSAGFTWDIIDRGVGNSLQGVAIFGAEGTELDSLGSQPAPPEPTVPAGTGTPLILANSAAFVADGEIKFNASTPTGGRTGFTADTVVFNANQGATDLVDNFSPLRIGTASVTDVSTNERFAIGRWNDGEYINEGPGTVDTTLTTAQGLHYLVASGVGTGFALPTMGSIEYELIAATAPTISDSSLAPGRFEADMTVLFGASPTVAMEGMITMPTASDDLVYSFATLGGIANPEQSETEFRVSFVRNTSFNLRDGLVTASDGSCGGDCNLQFNGYFAGDDALEMGLTYALSTQEVGQRISGAAIFGNGVFDDGIDDTGIALGAEGSVVAYSQIGARTLGVVSDTTITDGLLTALTSTAIAGNVRSVEFNGSTASYAVESGTLDGAIGWARYFAPDDENASFSRRATNGNRFSGLINDHHYMTWGTPVINMPMSGDITYSLYYATQVTSSGRDDVDKRGGFTGSLDVNFAAMNVGIDAQVAFDGATYALTTPNRLSITQDGLFTGRINTPAGATVPTSVNGFLAGDDAGYAGLNYLISIPGAALTGSAVFTADASGGGSGGGAAMVDGVVPLGVVNSGFAARGPRNVPAVSAEEISVVDGVFQNAKRGRTGGSISYGYTDASTGEVSGDQGVIGWQRFNAVFANSSGGTGQVIQSRPFVEQFWHTIWGAPLVNLPTSGLVNYEFIGGSTAHQTNAQPGEGTFSGDFAVDFATLNVGLEASVDFEGSVFQFSSEGGVAAPSIALQDDGFGLQRFFTTLDTEQIGVGGVVRGTEVSGFLAGDGATHAGITYAIGLSSSNKIVGTAAFRATSNTASNALPTRTTASIAPSVVPATMTGGNWARWGGTGSASVQGSGGGQGSKGLANPQAANLLPPGVDPAELATRLNAGTRSRETVIRQAERIMGGAITFARPGEAGVAQ